MSLLALLAAGGGATPPPDPIEVTAQVPTADDTANTITIPTVEGVQYLIGGAVVTGVYAVGDVTTYVTVTAQALPGYTLDTDPTEWELSFTASGGTLINLYPGATPQAVPAPIAEWDFREASAPYYTTAATGNDLPLYPQASNAPVPVDHELGRALHMFGDDWLAVPAESIGRLNMGANGKTQVSMAAWVYNVKPGQMCIGGIWGETFVPPTRQYALFGDLSSYGGDDMACFHISKDGGPTPGYGWSTDYSATPNKMVLGKWELHVGTYDGEKIVSYKDGVAYEHHSWGPTTRERDGWRNPYNFFEGLNSAPELFHVGSIADGTSGMHGMIRRLRVWDVALTPGQVLTLAAEHPAVDDPPALDVPYSLTDTELVTSTDKGGNFLSHTFTGLQTGTAAADRVVLVGVTFRGQFSSMPTLAGVTIAGSPATLAQSSGQDGTAFAYTVVPTGATADVAVTLTGTAAAWCHVTVLALTGAVPTHSGFSRNTGRKHISIDGVARGGLIVALARGNNIGFTWGPGSALVSESLPSGAVSCGMAVSTGRRNPIAATFGIATNGSFSAIGFDPS